MEDFELTPLNDLAYSRWSQLDLTGRRYGFSQEPLNEPSINANLTRYDCNTPEVYELILQIENRMFSYKMEQDRKKRDAEKNKPRRKK